GLYPDRDTSRRLFALETPPEKLRPVVDEIWKAFRGASH
ncbi:polyamine ABC transporter substrate-binding protein, partial [Pseudomonas aeruginosa]